MTKLTTNNKNLIDTMAELANTPNMNLGIDEIEFPDGTKEKFYYNGEADRQAAIAFAQICFNATNDTAKAKQMMSQCFALMTKGITPTEEILIDGITYYIDHNRKLLCDRYGEIIVELEDDEKEIFNDIRRKDAESVPFYAIEMNNSKVIVQIHGFGNKWLGNNPEAIPTVVRWMRKHNIKCDTKILTCTARGYGRTNDYIEMPKVD